MQNGRGRFLTLEGVDGAGKSTHVQWLVDHLRGQGLTVVCTREPGGTPLGESLRDLLLSRPMHLETETLLMFAARCEHLHALIAPALAQGHWVVCDRFTDATYAYQGGGRALGAPRIAALEAWMHPHLQPDCTLLFDVPLEVARERLLAGRTLDRFEQEDAAFFQRVRDAYLARAGQDPVRVRRIDASVTIAQIRERLAAIVQELLAVSPPGTP